jgi:hypothetical protein
MNLSVTGERCRCEPPSPSAGLHCAIAATIIRSAVLSDISAVTELREITEGRLPLSARANDQIDYSAGRAKDVRMSSSINPSAKQERFEITISRREQA